MAHSFLALAAACVATQRARNRIGLYAELDRPRLCMHRARILSGIRTGMATAIGLAAGLGVSVYGSSALDLMAFPHADRAPAQRAVLPAGHGEKYSALFGTRGGRWRRISPYVVATLEVLAADSPAKCLWCGVYSDEDSDLLARLLGGARRIVSPPHNVRRAAYLLPLAMASAANGSQGSAGELRPLYLRRPAISRPRPLVAPGSLGAS